MAKTMENGEQVNETLATDTLANLFADMNAKVTIRCGPQNGAVGVDGFHGPLDIPRAYEQHASEYETFVSSNWNAVRGELGKEVAALTTNTEKRDFFEQYIADGRWEPKAATLRSPLEQAVYDRLLAAGLESGDIKPGTSEKKKDAGINPALYTVLNDPSKTERGRALIEAAYVKHRDFDANIVKRNRQGAEGAEAAVAVSSDKLANAF